jgi:hypothetical protein
MKHFIILFTILVSCKSQNSLDDIDNKLKISGFNKSIWKLDSLACYPQYRRQQAYIIRSHKEQLRNYKACDIEKILGKPFKVEQTAKIFSYSYLISGEYCCDTIDQFKRDRINLYGIGAANISVSFKMEDSVFYDIIIGLP